MLLLSLRYTYFSQLGQNLSVLPELGVSCL